MQVGRNGSWRTGDGRPGTIPLGQFDVEGVDFVGADVRNSGRLSGVMPVHQPRCRFFKSTRNSERVSPTLMHRYPGSSAYVLEIQIFAVLRPGRSENGPRDGDPRRPFLRLTVE